ncbi:hypothetical protein [Spirillospora sp. NPDC047279]|uniref:hypothetical protein n=1 Tax=Spirillospora sp. NPDC047279 TaxID=3155478 RepID=UPI0033F09FF1
MTISTTPARDRRTWPLRRALCLLTAAACAPYITLKLIWLAGGDLGVSGDAATEMHSATFVAANAITMGMEIVAVVIVFAFTYPWGRRIPAWLVLAPMWVGTGLLAPIALGVPLGLAAQAVAGGSPIPENDDSGDMSGWVFAVVYGGFVLQAITLLAAFVLYARARWPEAFRRPVIRAGGTRAPQVLFVNGASVVAVACGVTQVLWAFTGGEFGGDTAYETVAQRTFAAVGGLLALAGAAGALALVHGRGSRPVLALTAAWTGAGHLLAGGLFAGAAGAAGAVNMYGALAGLLLGVAALLTLVDSRRAG